MCKLFTLKQKRNVIHKKYPVCGSNYSTTTTVIKQKYENVEIRCKIKASFFTTYLENMV